MPFKTFTDGTVLYAADVNAYWIQQHSVIKSADQTKATATVNPSATADSELIIPLLANTQYWIEFFLIVSNASSTPDIKISFTGPSGATFDWSHGGLTLGTTSTLNNVSRFYRSMGDLGTIGVVAGSTTAIPGYGRVVTAGSSGNLTLMWHQNNATTGDATNGTTVQANSVMIAQRLTV